jgi:DNA processing protein
MGLGEELSGARLPPRLADLAEPPQKLWLHGQLPRGPAVAIVGTRECTSEAAEWTRGLAAELAAAGVAILSGGAEGIDTAAHRGALDVGGVTVVVTPAGFDHPYPKENAELYQRIVETGGGYLSSYPDKVTAGRPHFFTRNSYLVALSHAVIVTQTRCYRGGALNAAKWARQLGRPLFVVPHSPWIEAGSGAVPLIRRGGRPLDRAKDVLKFLRASGLHPLPPGTPPVEEGPVQTELWPTPAESAGDPVLDAVRAGALHPDEIADRTGLSPATVQRRILTLTLSGVLVPGPLGSLKLVNPRID